MRKFGRICRLISIVSLLLLILLGSVTFFSLYARTFALFGLEVTFYLQLLLALFLLSIAGRLVRIAYAKRGNVRKTAAVIGMVLCMILGAAVTWNTCAKIEYSRLSADIVSEDGKHTLYRIIRSDLFGNTSAKYYIKSGFLTYDHVFDCDTGTIPEVIWQEDGFFYRDQFYSY